MEKIMDYDKILLKKAMLLVLFLVQFVIIVFWRKNGELSYDTFSALVIDSVVMLDIIATDVYTAWHMKRKHEYEV